MRTSSARAAAIPTRKEDTRATTPSGSARGTTWRNPNTAPYTPRMRKSRQQRGTPRCLYGKPSPSSPRKALSEAGRGDAVAESESLVSADAVPPATTLWLRMGKNVVSSQASLKHAPRAIARTEHKPPATSRPRWRNSETSSGTFDSRTLKTPWTMSVVPPIVAITAAIRRLPSRTSAAWLVTTKKIAPNAAPRNCTGTTANTGPIPAMSQ